MTNLHLLFSQEHTPKGKGRGNGASKSERAGGRWDKDSDNKKVTKFMLFDEHF